MKKSLKKILLIFFVIIAYSAQCQYYMDAVILNNGKDTIFGKIMSVTDSSLIIDRYNTIFSIPTQQIDNHIYKYREANVQEMALMKSIDNLTEEDLGYRTAGYYMRKSARNFYIGLPLFTLGTVNTILTFTVYEKYQSKTINHVVLAGGVATAAAGVFFMLRSFYFIDKSGKILDLDKTSLHVAPSYDGGIGMQLKF